MLQQHGLPDPPQYVAAPSPSVPSSASVGRGLELLHATLTVLWYELHERVASLRAGLADRRRRHLHSLLFAGYSCAERIALPSLLPPPPAPAVTRRHKRPLEHGRETVIIG